MIGQTVGNYRVTARLGAGGMGEVFRATDIRLGREVALKFSAEQFSERFEREARAVAALNHPNICTLHDVAPNYLVMELVEGMTLAERIVEGPLPLDEALAVARQIAAALEEAHEKGITHRDLKPSNIKIKPDGTVKVLDFGLAKIQAAQPTSGIDLSAAHGVTLSPTITSPAAITHAGLILGTAAYMAPEQAKGKPVDKRADIWAFGVVLYEMLTGRRPFQGNDVGDLLASVIKEEPAWDDVPLHTRRLLQRCLEKDPRKRLRDASGIELLLDDVAHAPATRAARSKPIHHWVIEGVLAAGVLVTAWLLWPARPADRPLIRLDVYLGPNINPGTLRGTDVVISPNGDRLAFVSQGGLFVRRLDQPDAIRLAGVERPHSPFFSPDGDWIGYFGSGLKKVPVTGGAVVSLTDGAGFGGSWGEDGYIVASLDGRRLSRIPAGGGAPVPLTELTEGEYGHGWPHVLPGAKAVIFTARRSTGDSIKMVTIDDRRVKTVYEGGLFGRYVPGAGGTGHLLFVNGGTLFAVPFDSDKLEVRGSPVPVLDGVGFSNVLSAGSAQLDVSRTGTLVYRSSGPGIGFASLQWVDASAKPQPLPLKPNTYTHPRLSPDGTRAALTVVSSAGQDIWVYDMARDSMQPVTFGGRTNQFPVWTPDGRYIVFTDGVGGTGMSWTRADGASAPQRLTESKNGQFPWSFSPDGKHLAYAEFPSGTGDIWIVPIEYDASGMKAGKPELFLQTAANELYPAFSPDGRWIAYRSFESTTSEIYVRAFPNTGGGKWVISVGGGSVPVWSPNGRELFYRTDDQRIMVVEYTQSKDAFSPGKPRQWSDVRLADSNQRNLDIAADGKRFLALFPVETVEAQALRNHVGFLQNFGDELRRRVH